MITEFLKNLGADAAVWASIAVFIAQRWLKNEKTEVDDLKKDVENLDKRVEKNEIKIGTVSEAVSELKGQLKR